MLHILHISLFTYSATADNVDVYLTYFVTHFFANFIAYLFAYSAYLAYLFYFSSAYAIAYIDACSTMLCILCIFVIIWHILHILSVALPVCRPAESATDPLGMRSIIALFPSLWGPSCSRTNTCYSLCSPLFYHKKRLESVLLLFASRTVLSLYCRREQEAASPVWKTLESHTRLVLIYCARKRWWTGTHPTKLCINQTESYTEYA